MNNSSPEYDHLPPHKFSRKAMALLLAASGVTGVSACDYGADGSTKTTASESITDNRSDTYIDSGSVGYGTTITGGDKVKHDDTASKLIAVDRLQALQDAQQAYAYFGEGDTSYLTSRLSTVTNENSFNPKEERQALAAMVAEEIVMRDAILDEPHTAKQPNDVRNVLHGASEKFIKEATSAFTSEKIASTLDDIQMGQAEPEDVLPKLVANHFPVSKVLKQLAQRVDAEDALRSVYSVDDVNEAVKDIGATTDTEIKKLISDTRDDIVARDIIGQYPYGVSKREAKKMIAKLKDRGLRKAVNDYVVATDRDDYEGMQSKKSQVYNFNESADKLRYNLNDKNNAAITKLRATATGFEEKMENIATESIDNLWGMEVKTLKGINKALDLSLLNKLKDSNHEPLLSAQLDFSNVSSNKVITLKTAGEDGDFRVLQQFAELYPDGKDSAWHFETSAEMPQGLQGQITTLLDPIRPLAEAAMKAGVLMNVRLGVDVTDGVAEDSDDESHYDPGDRTIYVMLPKNASTSGDMLRSVVVHEIVHALVDQAYSGIDATKQEVDDMNNACHALSDQVRKSFEGNVSAVKSSLSSLVRTTHGLDQQLFRHLLSNVKKGTIEDLSYYYPGEDTMIWGCDTPNFWENFTVIADNIGRSNDFDAEKFRKKYDDNDYFNDIVVAWNKASGEQSLYRLFNESAYLEGDSSDLYRFGHSEDNATELAASIVDGVITHTSDMKDAYDNAPTEEQAVIRRAMKACLNLLTNRYPNLKNVISQSYRQIVK